MQVFLSKLNIAKIQKLEKHSCVILYLETQNW